MGVQVRLVLYAPDQEMAEKAATAAFHRIAELDEIMSDYITSSELNRLSAAAGEGPVPIGEDLFTVLERSQRLARLSDGAFDVTVSPYVRLWRTSRRTARLPHPDSLALTRERAGWRNLRLDPEERTAHLLVPGMQLDLGGIAKGYAGDQALSVLREHGIHSALIELGGDIVTSNPPPGETGWRIEVANAAPGEQYRLLANAAISSSGDTEQYVEIDGRRYSHIVDPRTGLGLTDRIAVTVVGPNGLTTDGLATMLSVLGPERGLPLVARHYPDVKVYIRRVNEPETAHGAP